MASSFQTPRKTLIHSKSGLRIVATNEELKSPFIIPEPEWISDTDVTNCSICKVKFSFITRKHHCRRCGDIFCNTCCHQKLKLQRMCFIDPVRVCNICAPITASENEFFDHHLKILTNGATLVLESSKIIKTTSDVLQIKLASDHKHLIFEGVSLAPLDIRSITYVEVVKDIGTVDKFEESIEDLWSVVIEFDMGMKTKLKLACAAELANRKSGYSWMFALNQAFKLLNH
uniref:FYVE-type domain-containing protein n=1 Tax=Clastoptera arizonana TaxID=38151 RepID=A0A1B6EG59_9HEMI